MIKILHCADLHLGDLNGPVKDGRNARREDTLRCMREIAKRAAVENPNVAIIAGDLFNRSRVWADTALDDIDAAIADFIRPLCRASEKVVLLFGTQNHDNPKAFNTLRHLTEGLHNLTIYTTPEVETLTTSAGPVQILAMPGFDKGRLRAFIPDADAETENQNATTLVNEIIMGLSAEAYKTKPAARILVAHYTVAGCESESGQTFLAGQDVVILPQTIDSAGVTLACFGHIHKPQKLNCNTPAYYSGSPNQLTFNDEGMKHGFYIHEIENGKVTTRQIFTPERRHLTVRMTEDQIAGFIATGQAEGVPEEARDAILRIIYKATPEQDKQLNRAALQTELLQNHGAFHVADFQREENNDLILADTSADDSPKDTLHRYLAADETLNEADITRIEDLAEPIIRAADDGREADRHAGAFTPMRIEVTNYRSYTHAEFDFSDIRMAMVNGQNGVGKSSLFMDAIADCLYEQSREGATGEWLRVGEKKGAILFEFEMGGSDYRVARTRTASGKGTLALARKDPDTGEWLNMSDTTMRLTQEAINKVVGMDCQTFCSIALIRQDAYGLFLEAGSDQRMEVLSNLLNLGLYGRAEEIAKTHATEQRRTIAQMNDRMDVLDTQIRQREKIEAQMQEAKAQRELKAAQTAAIESQIKAVEREEALRQEKVRQAEAAAKPKKPKQSGSKKKVLTKLNSFLKQTEPETVEFLYHDLQATGNAVTYKELREAYLAGGLTQDQLEKWQHKYSKLVTGTLKPKWEQAAAQAAQEIKDKYPYFLYEPGAGAAADWIKQHGAELVTNLAQDQMDALNAMVGYFSGNTAITPDEAARMMRPCIGLTKPQALANIHYQDAVKAAYLKQHPKAKQETLDKKAKDAGARYAARQHRYRAQSIARTELAYGYNAGAYGATKDAQAQGYIGECKKKWLTAYDERVCPICSAMDEETVDMDAPFSNGKLLPPGHPQCRCAVAYEETDNANLQPQAANGTMNAQNQPQSAPQQPTAAQPAAAQPQTQQPPLVQTTPADPNAPQIPPELKTPSGMTYKGPANLGGTGEMYVFEDADGKQWLFKPAQDKGGHAPQDFRAYAQEAGYKVQSIVDPSTAVPVGTDALCVPTGKGNLSYKFGAYQERLNTLDEGGLKYWQKGHVMGWEDYDLQDTDAFQQLQREHVTDWLLGNYDSHGGNFVTRMDGQLIGIDKEQAFKYISDPKSHTMSYTYHPNAKYGETEPVYNTLFRKYAKGDIDLDLNDSLKYIQRVEQIPDAEYREIFRSYAESLHGPGADAEKMLDAIVERKANLRETYRAFYSELETERNGVKTVFQFSDEIAGTATPKPVPKPTTPKAPKTTPAPVATPKPTKAPVKTDGGYMVQDVLDDLTVLPNTQNGVAIRSDGGMVEQMSLRGRKITVDGRDVYEISGKLTEDTWEAAARNAKSRGYQRDIEFMLKNQDGTYSSRNVGMKLDGYRILDTNQSVFETYADTMGKDQFSMAGYFRVQIEATGDPVADRKALEQILDKAGLQNLTVDPTDAEELILKKTRIAWQQDPKAMEKCRYMTGTAREKEIDAILNNAGISDNRVRNMKLQEVFPGYSTYIDDAAGLEYRKAGATHIWAGVEGEDSVVAICRSDGLTATNYRITGGMKKCGASPGKDMKTGGADNVFVRLGTNDQTKYRSNYLGGQYRIIIDPEEMSRTDWYAYTCDSFGRARPETSAWQKRPSTKAFVKKMKRNYEWDNELMFRQGISKDKFIGISCETDADRTRLLDAFHAQGITELNGVPLEDFIQVTVQIGEDSQRGILGLSGYTAPF